MLIRDLAQVATPAGRAAPLRGAAVYIDAFYEFTDRERRMIVALAQSCASVELTLTIDPASRTLADVHHIPDDLSLFHKTESAYRLLRLAIEEAGVRIEPTLLQAASENDKAALEQVEAHIARQVTGAARSNLQRPSMAQDMQKGRRTEIAEINGFIAQKAKDAGLTAPTHERIVEVVQKVERGELSPKPELLFFND